MARFLLAAKRVIGVRRILYPEDYSGVHANADDLGSTVLDIAMPWWTRGLGRATQFYQSEVWQSGSFGKFGKNKPTPREVFNLLD